MLAIKNRNHRSKPENGASLFSLSLRDDSRDRGGRTKSGTEVERVSVRGKIKS
jgi:hypothetical protein